MSQSALEWMAKNFIDQTREVVPGADIAVVVVTASKTDSEVEDVLYFGEGDGETIADALSLISEKLEAGAGRRH